MKKHLFSFFLLATFSVTGCRYKYKVTSDFTYKDDTVVIADTLPTVSGAKAHIVLLYGQSNADGVSHVEYLQSKNPEKYNEYSVGYDNVLINFQNDGNGNSSSREFRKCTLCCGYGEKTFGPESGISEIMSKTYPDEQTFIIKWTWGGTFLHSQWLDNNRNRGALYNSSMDFTLKCLSYLKDKGYNLSLDGICWMQGESDSCVYTTSEPYYKDTVAFVSLLRHDLNQYSSNLRFIDAGINEELGMWPHAKEINKAKQKFAKESKLNIYIDTNGLGLTSLQEPEGQIDGAHYDALSMVSLGQAFGQELVRK